MDSGAMIYIPNSIKIVSGIRKLVGVLQTQRQRGDLINLLVFFQNKESRIKINSYIHLSPYRPDRLWGPPNPL
jgi:hypothetical protein